MKQQRVILDTVNPENSASKLPQLITFYINTNRDKLEYKDGSIPFSITTFSKFSALAPDFVNLYSIGKTAGTRITKKYILENYYVYRIADYGNQSLSPSISDFVPFVYDSLGNKLPQYMVGIIRNFTTKEAFIIIKKDNLDTDESISVIIDYKRNKKVKVLNRNISTTRDGVFSFNLSTEGSELSDVDALAFFIKEGTKYYEVKNSDYFFKIDGFKYSKSSGSTFAAQQESYFEFLEFQGALNKKYHNIDITLNDNFKNINTLYIRDRNNYSNYYFNTYDIIGNEIFYRLANISVYSYDADIERLGRLIPGIDFYIDGNDKLIIPTATTTSVYEVFVRPSSGQVFSFYSESNGLVFNITDALYNNNFGKWNPDIANSTVLIFTNNKFVKNEHSGTVTTSTSGTEYILEDIEWNLNSDGIVPGIMTTTLVNSSHDFDNFNKYQISTDPYFNTYGENFAVGTDFTEQEVYLYDTSLDFLLDTAEPYITDNTVGSDIDIRIQGIDDPYTDTTYNAGVHILDTVNDNYYDFQISDGSGNPKVTNLLLTNTVVQNIEAQISKLKKNYQGMIGNSNLTYSHYSTRVNAKRFLFLVLKGISGNTFTLTYRDASNNIIKKEYNCTLDANGLYVSLPFFLDTFATENEQTGIQFEVDGNVTHYYIFR